MECVICWETILTSDADTFCAHKAHSMCAPCFFHMRRLKNNKCPVCRSSEGGSRSAYTQRLVEVLEVEENREEYILRVRDGICEAAGRAFFLIYLFSTLFMIVAMNVAVVVQT